jgi:aminomethyltransferase
MVEFCGWDMPVQYKLGIIPSHLHTRQKSGVFDVSHMLQLEITGKDRFDFLESLCVADVRGLPLNGAALSVLLTDKGTIIDDTMITRNDDHIYMVVNAGCADKDMAHFKQQLEKWKGKVFASLFLVCVCVLLFFSFLFQNKGRSNQELVGQLEFGCSSGT